MHVSFSFDPGFTSLMERLKSKYPNSIFEIDGISDQQLDISEFSKSFFQTDVVADSSIDENANVDSNSVIVYNHEAYKPIFRLNSYYLLWKRMKKLLGKESADQVLEAQISGDIYINDSHGIGSGSPYCFNYATYDIHLQGLPMIDKITSVPPKHLLAFKSQVEQFVIIAANSTLGATGLADLLLTLSFYVKKIIETKRDSHFEFKDEKNCWEYIKQNLISLIYTFNQPMRSAQSPFTNISLFDRYFLESLGSDMIFSDGSRLDIEIVQKLQRLFLETMNEEMDRTPITFPVVTACFSRNGSVGVRDNEFLQLIAENNLKYGFINIYCGKTSTLSSCCRLRSETDNEYFNAFGSGSSKIGSLGVVTINLPRIAVKTKEKGLFIKEAVRLADLASKVNLVKRSIVRERIENGNHPLYSLGFADLNRQYSTVGVIGLSEALNFMGTDILQPEGEEVLADVLKALDATIKRHESTYAAPHNLELVPGESLAVKLAKKDRILGYNNKYTFYSNQIVPLYSSIDIIDRMVLQSRFDSLFSGGSIAHINLEQRLEDVETMKSIIDMAAGFGVVYWAVNYLLQRCQRGHMSIGKDRICQMCGEKITDRFTRVVGFLANTKNWNEIRREVDFPSRHFYDGIGCSESEESRELSLLER